MVGTLIRKYALVEPPATQRELDLQALADVDALRTLLQTATGPEIDTWAAANANSLPEIRNTLRAVLKLLAARARL